MSTFDCNNLASAQARIRELEQERERHLEDLRRKGDINLHLLDEKISLQAQLAAVTQERDMQIGNNIFAKGRMDQLEVN